MDRKNDTPSPRSSSATNAAHPAPEAGEDGRAQSSSSRFAALLFLATFFGSLLGVIADLSDASGLARPVLEIVDPSPRLHIAGSNTVLGEGLSVADEWTEMFTAQQQTVSRVPLVGRVERSPLVETSAVGSLDGFQLAVQGDVDLLVTSEPMPPDVYQSLQQSNVDVQCATVIGYDVIAFVTDINNRLPQITTRDMAGILNGDIINWQQVGGADRPIRILARQGSGTTDLVLQNFTGSGRFRDHFLSCPSNEACLDTTLSTPGALYWVSTAWLQTQPPRYLRLVLIQRGNLPVQDPLSDTFAPREYTRELMRPLYMYVLGGDNHSPASTQLAVDYLAMVRGVRGQEVLEEDHFYTHFDPPADIPIQHPSGFGTADNGLPQICRS